MNLALKSNGQDYAYNSFIKVVFRAEKFEDR